MKMPWNSCSCEHSAQVFSSVQWRPKKNSGEQFFSYHFYKQDSLPTLNNFLSLVRHDRFTFIRKRINSRKPHSPKLVASESYRSTLYSTTPKKNNTCCKRFFFENVGSRMAIEFLNFSLTYFQKNDNGWKIKQNAKKIHWSVP